MVTFIAGEPVVSNMEKIYKGRYWRDNLRMALLLGSLGIILVFLPLLVLIPMAFSAIKDGTLVNLLYIAMPFYLFFLVGGAACLYILYESIQERLVISGSILYYVGPFSRKRIQAMNIDKIMLFNSEKPVIIYDYSDDKKRFILPGWEKGYYIDDLILDLKRINPGIQVVDMRTHEDEADQ